VEVLVTAFHAAHDLDFDRVFRNPERLSDHSLRKTFEFAQNNDFTASGKERVDGFDEESDFFAGAHRFDNARPTIHDGERLRFHYGADRRRTIPSAGIEGQMAGDRKEQRLGGVNGLREAGFPNAEIGFLRDVVYVTDERKRIAEIGFELRVVQVHFLREPAGLVREPRKL
jgi:hypothetical protein